MTELRKQVIRELRRCATTDEAAEIVELMYTSDLSVRALNAILFACRDDDAVSKYGVTVSWAKLSKLDSTALTAGHSIGPVTADEALRWLDKHRPARVAAVDSCTHKLETAHAVKAVVVERVDAFLGTHGAAIIAAVVEKLVDRELNRSKSDQ